MRLSLSRSFPVLGVGLLGLSLTLAGCGGGGGGGGTTPPPPLPGCANGTGTPITVSGDVRYQRLVLSSGGVGPGTQLKAARFVDVEVFNAAGTVCYGRTSTDAAGSYALTVAPPDGSTIQVRAYSRTSEDPTRDYTVHEADPPFSDTHDGNNAFSWSVGGITATGSPVTPRSEGRIDTGTSASDQATACSLATRSPRTTETQRIPARANSCWR